LKTRSLFYCDICDDLERYPRKPTMSTATSQSTSQDPLPQECCLLIYQESALPTQNRHIAVVQSWASARRFVACLKAQTIATSQGFPIDINIRDHVGGVGFDLREGEAEIRVRVSEVLFWGEGVRSDRVVYQVECLI
jgi:hypothetical protein